MNTDLERMIQGIYAELDELRISTNRSANTNGSSPSIFDLQDTASCFKRYPPPLGDHAISEQVFAQEDDFSSLEDINEDG